MKIINMQRYTLITLIVLVSCFRAGAQDINAFVLKIDSLAQDDSISNDEILYLLSFGNDIQHFEQEGYRNLDDEITFRKLGLLLNYRENDSAFKTLISSLDAASIQLFFVLKGVTKFSPGVYASEDAPKLKLWSFNYDVGFGQGYALRKDDWEVNFRPVWAVELNVLRFLTYRDEYTDLEQPGSGHLILGANLNYILDKTELLILGGPKLGYGTTMQNLNRYGLVIDYMFNYRRNYVGLEVFITSDILTFSMHTYLNGHESMMFMKIKCNFGKLVTRPAKY